MLKKISNKYKRLKYFSKEIGFFNSVKLIIFEKRKKGLLSLKISSLKYPVTLRANTSDIETFEQIFIRKDYEIEINIEPKFIIDGGAYIGLSTIYLSNRFPEAMIIAIEPAKINFEMLKKNTLNYKNIIVSNAALWPIKSSLSIRDEGLGEWGFLVKEISDSTNDFVDAVTINEIVEKYNIQSIDILKIDIEGSEVELFSDFYERWLNYVQILIIELHESLRPGCSNVLNAALSKYEFTHTQKGENDVYINKNPLKYIYK